MNQLSPEKLAQIKDLIKDLDFNPVNQSLIKDNKAIFVYNKNVYRCRMPNQRIQSEAEDEQNRVKVLMYQKDGTITKKQLIKVLKEKQNVDIEALEKRREEIKKELHDVCIDLAIADPDNEQNIEDLKAKKKDVEAKLTDIVIEIVEWLSPCIEEQVKLSFYSFLAYSCTEKHIDKENDKWEPVWKSFEEYKEDESGLSTIALQKMQSLLIHLSQ